MSNTTARAIVTIEITSLGSWHGACTIEQVREQAAEHAMSIIRKLPERNNIRIIGDPKITTVIVEDDRP